MQKQVNDIIHIQDLETTTLIGIYPHEKITKQPLIISLKIYTDIKLAAKTDNINHTIDYAKISKFILNYINSNHFNLLETLAENICDVLIKEFHISKIDLEIKKPLALKDISKKSVVSLKISRHST